MYSTTRHKLLTKLVAIMLMLLAVAAPAQAQTKKQLERDKAKIEKEIVRLTNELSKARKTTKASANQINLIKKRITERNNLINNINKQMGLLDRQINRTEDSLRVVRGQIDSMKVEYAQVVRTLYGLRQNLNSTTLVLDNETYNYSYLKLKYFNEYSRYRRHQATTIRRKEVQFQDMSLDLQRQRKEKSSLLSQEKKQKDALSREQQQQQQKLNKSQQDEKSLKQQIAKKEKQKQQLQNQIQQLINAEVAKTSTASGGGTAGGKGSGKSSTSGGSSGSGKVYSDAASSDFVQNKGRLSWPVYYRSVAREYGLYTHSSGGQNRNYGIDLNCAAGATVNAVFSGTVARVFTAPNGSKGVIIRHGSYMTVYAGLGTVSVSQGTKVTTRQAIGTVYSSGEETSEFSFQVWCGKDALNPRHWLK